MINKNTQCSSLENVKLVGTLSSYKSAGLNDSEKAAVLLGLYLNQGRLFAYEEKAKKDVLEVLEIVRAKHINKLVIPGKEDELFQLISRAIYLMRMEKPDCSNEEFTDLQNKIFETLNDKQVMNYALGYSISSLLIYAQTGQEDAASKIDNGMYSLTLYLSFKDESLHQKYKELNLLLKQMAKDSTFPKATVSRLLKEILDELCICGPKYHMLISR